MITVAIVPCERVLRESPIDHCEGFVRSYVLFAHQLLFIHQYYQTITLGQSILYFIWSTLYEDLSTYSYLKQSESQYAFFGSITKQERPCINPARQTDRDSAPDLLIILISQFIYSHLSYLSFCRNFNKITMED